MLCSTVPLSIILLVHVWICVRLGGGGGGGRVEIVTQAKMRNIKSSISPIFSPLNSIHGNLTLQL